MSTLPQPLIIVADDDTLIHTVMKHHLEAWGYRADCVANTEALVKRLEQERPAALLLDLFFGEANGLEVLQQILQQYPSLPIILLTAHGSIETAVVAIKRGAYDYLSKPPDLRRMREVLRQATDRRGPDSRLLMIRPEPEETTAIGKLRGQSPAMRELTALIESVAPTDATVLILGESGTGKELTARALHDQSSRSKGPFVPVNMAALPRELIESTLFGHEKGSFTGAVQAQLGCCEAADKGTLFLDEIGEMDLSLQAKLLRFLQEREITRVGSNKSRAVDVRVVAATNRNLLEQVKKSLFREDLYYRLNVVPITLPPLRERREDIPQLAKRFLGRFSVKYKKPVVEFSQLALERMTNYDWPGNIRQLENLVERLVILSTGPRIGAEELPAELIASTVIAPAAPPPDPGVLLQPPSNASGLRRIEEVERLAICQALKQAAGNVREAARILGLGQATVYRKIKRYNLSPEGLAREEEPLPVEPVVVPPEIAPPETTS